jgi:predicted nucleotidyltransferase
MKQNNLHVETVSVTLWGILRQLMNMEQLLPFRLVGGTALSLQLGHRMSADIDLFTDADYRSIDFDTIDKILQDEFPFVEILYAGNDSFGKTYYIGKSKDDVVKVDMFYKDFWDIHELMVSVSAIPIPVFFADNGGTLFFHPAIG